jgi:hypothetical protein
MSLSLPLLRVLLEQLPEATGLPSKSPSESVYNPQTFRQRLSAKTNGCPSTLPSSKPEFIREFHSLMQMDGGQDASFLERGLGLVGVVDILEDAFRSLPDDVALNELVREIHATAVGYYTDVGIIVSLFRLRFMT